MQPGHLGHTMSNIYKTRYKLVKKLGPTNNPIQNITLPKITRPFINFDLDKLTSGICTNCAQKRYPRTFLNITAMHISCTSALRRKVTKVAALRLRWKVEMELW